MIIYGFIQIFEDLKLRFQERTQEEIKEEVKENNRVENNLNQSHLA